jgi:hypothetical protein
LLEPALTTGPILGNNAEEAISIWFAQAARVHQGLARWRRLALYAGTSGHRLVSFDIAQFHHEDGARWVALPFDIATGPPASGKVSLALHRAVQPAADQPWVGLLLDEWTEVIPSAAEQVGAVFQFDSPGAQAPQAVLLAVPPVRTERWDLDILIRIMHQTLELARIRALDLENIGLYGQLIPMTFLAANAENDTISTPILEFVAKEVSIVTQES